MMKDEQEPIESAGEAVNDTASEVGDTAGEAVQTIAETVQDIAETVADTTVDIGETARDEIKDKVATLEQAVSELRAQVGALAPAQAYAPAREDEEDYSEPEPAAMSEIETPRASEPVHKTRPGPHYLHHKKR